MSESLPFPLTWLLMPLFGLFVGLYVSALGGGGGLFFVPGLNLLFNIPTQLAVSTSLVSIIPTTIISTLSHQRHGNLNLRIGMIFAAGGISGSLIGAYGSSLISPIVLAKIFGAFCIAISVPMGIMTRKRMKPSDSTERTAHPLTRKKGIFGLLLGIFSGAMSGFLGISGTPPVIAGLYLMGYPALTVVGTSAFVLIFNALSGAVGHLMVGQFDWMLVLLLSGGAATGAFLGPRLLSKLNKATVEKLYGPLFIAPSVVLGILMVLR